MKYVSFIFGALVVIASFLGIWRVLPPVGTKMDAYSEHLIFLFTSGILFGALVMMPTIITAALKSFFGIVGQYIPVVGGRRPADPPAPTPPAGGPQ